MKDSIARRAAGAALFALAATTMSTEAAIIPVAEDVMTSSFFTGANRVRGYAGDNRPVLRVSTDAPFGQAGAETIYLAFAYDFTANFTGPVSARLTVESVSGGFGADAGPGHAFTVSAHAVLADPLTTILDDTQPNGSTDWLNFYQQSIAPAVPAARTAVNSFGQVSFDVSAIVNDWIAGANPVFVIALTGLNDGSGQDFLHGFLDNSSTPGASFLTVTAVPLPGAVLCFVPALAALAMRRRGSPS